MALRFDPAAILAPGGIASGLDDLGAAVVRALDRRAERKYGLEAEQRRRGEALTDEARRRRFQWWHDAAAAGPEEAPGYMTDPELNEREKAQLEAIRMGALNSRLARGAGDTPALPPIVPPAPTRLEDRPILDDIGRPTGAKTKEEVPRSLTERVSEVLGRANRAAQTRGGAPYAEALTDYAESGQRTADAINATGPWDAFEGSPAMDVIAEGGQAFEEGTTVPASRFAEALSAHGALAEALSPTREPAPMEQQIAVGRGMDTAPGQALPAGPAPAAPAGGQKQVSRRAIAASKVGTGPGQFPTLEAAEAAAVAAGYTIVP